MAVLRLPNDLISSSIRDLRSPQREAVTGTRRFLPREELVEELAESVLPVRARANFEREQIEENQALANKARKQARTDALVSTGINVTRLGFETGVLGGGGEVQL